MLKQQKPAPFDRGLVTGEVALPARDAGDQNDGVLRDIKIASSAKKNGQAPFGHCLPLNKQPLSPHSGQVHTRGLPNPYLLCMSPIA
jgi:hypothetical protein